VFCPELSASRTWGRGDTKHCRAPVTAQSCAPLQAALSAASATLLAPMRLLMGARQRIR